VYETNKVVGNVLNEIYSPEQLPIEKGNLKLNSIGGDRGDALWISDNSGQWKDYGGVLIDTKKVFQGKDFKQLSDKDKKDYDFLIKKAQQLLKERPDLETLGKKLKNKEIGVADFVVTKVEYDKGAEDLSFTVDSEEFHSSNSYGVGNRRGYFEFGLNHNAYNVGTTPDQAIKKILEMVKESLGNLYGESNPKQAKKDAKELLALLSPITSSLIAAQNKKNDIMGNWSGTDGSRWRTMKYTVDPKIRALINQLKKININYEDFLSIEKELKKF
jgi:hypothetical protein